MKVQELYARLRILELTAHSCCNKVDNRIQSLDDAHSEIRKEWETFFRLWIESRKKGREPQGPRQEGK